MLRSHPQGHYRFLQGIEPYSCGVVAEPGYEIVHVRLPALIPWRRGFEVIDGLLRGVGAERSALCALELRSPAPFSMEEFIEFNRGYCAVLTGWNLAVAGLNPVARTNVAPAASPPSTPSVHAFSYVRPNPDASRPTLIVAGAGELREGILESHRIIRRGEISPEAIREKAAYVLDVIEERLHGLGAGWADVTTVNLYTVHDLEPLLRRLLTERLGPAIRDGWCWHLSRPPVVDIEFEMDVRGVAREANPGKAR